MSCITISAGRITTKLQVVLTGQASLNAEAQLLGKSGEELQRFELRNGINELSLEHHAPGTYTLRVSTEKEVEVKEITIEA